jgi:hypothetical protein
MADIDYDLLAEKLAEAVVRAMSSVSEAKDRAAMLDKEDRSRAASIAETFKLTKAIKDAGSSASAFKRVLLNQQANYLDLEKTLEKLDQEIENDKDSLRKLGEAADGAAAASKQFELQQKIQERAHQAREVKLTNFYNALSNASLGVIKFSDGLASTLGAAGGSLIKGLQRGSSSIETSSALMTAGVDLAQGAATGAAGAMQGLGTAALALPGKFKALGVGLIGLGTVVGYSTDKIAKLVKFGIDILGAELEKTVEAYKQTNRAGALFVDGMSGMRNAAHAAGLTLSQFANVLSKASPDLAAVGMGVTEGSKRMGGAIAAGGSTMKTQLMNLGYSFEEQAGLVAETMALMRQSGGPLTASNRVVAQETLKYAENLRVISAITGEDARKKADQVRQQASQLAFQQKLAGMDETQRLGVVKAMQNMSDLERRNFMDMVNFGTVINREGAAASAMSSGLTNAVNSYYNALTSGTLNEINARKISAQNAEQQKKDYLGLTDIATAQAAGIGGLAGLLGEILGKELEYRNKVTTEAIAAGEELAGKQKITNDKLTTSVNETAVTVQKLQIALEKELLGSITLYATSVKEMNKLILTAIEDLKKSQNSSSTTTEEPSLIKKVGREATGYAAGLGAGALTLLGGGAATIATGGAAAIPTMLGTGAAAYYGREAGLELFDRLDSWFNKKEGKARGGIARGPSTGYIEKLHGVEAVVPLASGSIPVTVDMMNNKPTKADEVGVDSATIGMFYNIGNALSMAVKDLQLAAANQFNSGNELSSTIKDLQLAAANQFNSDALITTIKDLQAIAANRFSGAESTIKLISDQQESSKTNIMPNAFEMVQLKEITDNRTINEYLEPKLNSLEMSRNILADFGQGIDVTLADLKAEVKKVANEVAPNVIEKETNSGADLAQINIVVDQLRISNRDVKEAMLMQNKLLEESMKTMQDLLSVASDTRNYSQTLVQNTL